ncbi:hypothetical protein OEZ86_013227 [Tetradesmus obliquus]|nr:hypothetical protein OEZ86_013227 [Tetradesmus obliquus]
MNPPRGGMWYELEHLKDYAENVVIITCTDPPSVAEGWNAVFQAFPDEPWGVYCARDTAWMPGSLQKLAGHMWGATKDNSIELGIMQWTFNIGGGAYNSFAMTRSAINRFGLFDENIYPSFYEDNDFQLRQARMQPPMQPKTLEGVVMHHGKPHESGYSSGVHTPDDPTHKDAEQNIRAAWQQRFVVNGNYIYRKWGCQPGSWASCAYKTPFNKTVPVWYWYTSKEQRQLDSGLSLREGKLFDAQGNAVYTLPATFNGWTGYTETKPVCRLSGPLGINGNTTSGIICI